jgi:hypothetical protein
MLMTMTTTTTMTMMTLGELLRGTFHRSFFLHEQFDQTHVQLLAHTVFSVFRWIVLLQNMRNLGIARNNYHDSVLAYLLKVRPLQGPFECRVTCVNAYNEL